MKKITVVILVLLAVLILLCLFLRIDREKGLPLGSSIPEILIRDSFGDMVTLKREEGRILVMFFHYKCGHCQYQLNILEENIGIFSKVSLYFLTDDASFLRNGIHKNWKKLWIAENVTFAIVDKKEFKNNFGSLIKPSIYIFNQEGSLVSKIFGEVKLQRLLKELYKPIESSK